MGWPFDDASWNEITGAYYAAVGSEMIWVGITVVICIVSLVVGARHEGETYRRAGE
ncbi:MAG: hypothetical protein AAGD47_07535 [Pseudomonadota bacterium]